MGNKVFMVKTTGYCVEGTFIFVEKNEEEAKNSYETYIKENVVINKWNKKNYQIKEIIEVSLSKTGLIHEDDGDR